MNMDEVKITKAMERELKSRGLTADDLTAEELERLHRETILKRKGFGILDGVLSNTDIYFRRMRNKKKPE